MDFNRSLSVMVLENQPFVACLSSDRCYDASSFAFASLFEEVVKAP
jgi:hypothetical protein